MWILGRRGALMVLLLASACIAGCGPAEGNLASEVPTAAGRAELNAVGAQTADSALSSEAQSADAESTNAASHSTPDVAGLAELPQYRRANGAVSGRIKSVGSDTMNNLMTLWLEGFKRFYPNVETEIEGKGSATAPPALIQGAATFGPMSRPMKDKEISEFTEEFGYPPTELPTGIDMLAVYVHRDNPIKGLTLAQVDAIFSTSRRGGAAKDIKTWGDLGLTGDWADKPISLYGRNSASGTYGFFKEVALFGGDFKNSVKEQPGSSAVVQGVAADPNGIGYSGMGYKTADVRVVPIAPEEGDEFVAVTAENAYTGEYPLARYLLVYVNYKPGSQLEPLRREFIRYVYSREGQAAVSKDGYLPVGGRIAENVLGSVGIEATE